jgi:hypothetical protein
MVFNRSFIACYSKPKSVIKNLRIGLGKMNKKKYVKSKKKFAIRKLKGVHKVAHVALKKKPLKKKQNAHKGRNSRKSKKFKILLSKGRAFGEPSTIKQIN